MMVVGSGGCCYCATVAQCRACSISHEVTLACRLIMLSANELFLPFDSRCKFDLLHQIVWFELVNQCAI